MVANENRVVNKEPYKYDFSELKKQLNKITSTADKIKYILEIKTEFQQEVGMLDFGDDDFLKKCNLEIDKLNEFQKIETTNITVENQVVEPPLKTLNWQGTTLEFSELSKALCESGLIGKVKNDKEVFESMKQFFNVEDFDKSDKLKQVRNRTKELTPLINRLEVALTNWIKRKD
jgi:6-pyruvoyl-tetrahydropterin synthase